VFEKVQFDRELKRLERHANAGYFVALHIRFTSPLMTFQTYDQAWTDHYTNNGYVLRDPMTAWAFSATGWIRWSNPELHDPYGIFGEGRKFGLNHGVTVSAGPIASRSIISLARHDREFTDREIGEILEVAHHLHEMTEPPESLTPAQAEALQYIASGDRHEAAAAKLGISVSALKARLNSARQRLMARTTAEAIQRAKDYGLL
jgi:LuxR family transcriptional regulator